MAVKRKVAFVRVARGRKVLSDEPPPTVEPGRIPRISRLMALAIQCDRLLREGKVEDMSALARLLHVTQPRMTQIMNLTLLAPDIQEELLLLPRVFHGRDPIHEKMLRPIAVEVDWEPESAAAEIRLVADEVGKGRLFIHDQITVDSDVVALSRAAVRQQQISLVCVDYLQRFHGANQYGNKWGSRHQEVSSIAAKLADLSRASGCSVLLASQIKKTDDHSKVPRSADLKESGDIENHATQVFLLHRNLSSKEELRGDPNVRMGIRVAKNRNGDTCGAVFEFHRPTMTIGSPIMGGQE